MHSFRPLWICAVLLLPTGGTAEQVLIPIIRQGNTAKKQPLTEWSTFFRVANYHDADYVSLVQVATLLNAEWIWNKGAKQGDFRLGGNTVRLFVNSTRVSVAGQPATLDHPTVKNEDGFWVPVNFFASDVFFRATRTRLQWPPPPDEPAPKVASDAPAEKFVVKKVAAPVTATPIQNPAKAKALRRIIIDPGHGGKDPGAVGRGGAMEKDVNLRVSLELAELLRESYGYEVLLTRMEDSFVPLAERPRLANKYEGDLFISLHCNAAHSKKQKGFEVYFLSEHASDSHADAVARLENAVISLEGKEVPTPSRVKQVLRSLEVTANINEASEAGSLIEKNLADRLSEPSLGVKQAAFYVLRGAEMPAVLVEMAFISNRAEEKLLQSASFRKKLVEGIGAGVVAYDVRKQKERS